VDGQTRHNLRQHPLQCWLRLDADAGEEDAAEVLWATFSLEDSSPILALSGADAPLWDEAEAGNDSDSDQLRILLLQCRYNNLVRITL